VAFYTDTIPYFVLLDNAAGNMNEKELITASQEWYNARASTDDKRQKILQSHSIFIAQLANGGALSDKMKSMRRRSSGIHTRKSSSSGSRRSKVKVASVPQDLENADDNKKDSHRISNG